MSNKQCLSGSEVSADFVFAIDDMDKNSFKESNNQPSHSRLCVLPH